MYEHDSAHGLSQPLPHTDRIKSELWEAQRGRGGGGVGGADSMLQLTPNVHVWINAKRVTGKREWPVILEGAMLIV